MAKPIIVIDGTPHKVVPPYSGAEYADVPDVDCPKCSEPLQVQGAGKHIVEYDTYASTAVCTKCHEAVGELRLKVNTLFGLEEDERVFSMGIKIY